MGKVVGFHARSTKKPTISSGEQLPLILSRLLAAGATDFTRVALDAWGHHEVEPQELLELCTTYASVKGLEEL